MNSGLVPGPRGLPSPPRSPIRPLPVSTGACHSLPCHPATSTGSSCCRTESPGPLLCLRDARAFFPSTQARLRCSKSHLRSGEAATQDLFVIVHRPPPSRSLPALALPLSCTAWVPGDRSHPLCVERGHASVSGFALSQQAANVIQRKPRDTDAHTITTWCARSCGLQ